MMERQEVGERIWEEKDGDDSRNSSGGRILEGGHCHNPGHIEELDDEGRLLEDKSSYYRVTDEERDRMGEICDPYEGL